MTPLHEILKLLEYTLDVYGCAIYTALDLNAKSYSAWRTGRRKGACIHAYEKFKARIGIDLYQSQQKGKIVITDWDKFEAWYEKLPKPRPFGSMDTSVLHIVPNDNLKVYFIKSPLENKTL